MTVIRYLGKGLGWSAFQCFTMMMAMFASLFFVFSGGVFGSADTGLLLAAAGTIIAFGGAWYFALRIWFDVQKNPLQAILFGLLPILFLAWNQYSYLFLSGVGDDWRLGCVFMSPVFVFYCAVYAVVLFPAYVLGLFKFVFPASGALQWSVRIMALIVAMVVLGAALIGLSAWVQHVSLPEFFNLAMK